MFAFMNREALARTAELGQAVYWSRSRQRLWHKGEESGHFQQVHEMRLDCDNDVLLLKVTQLGHEPRHRLPHRPAQLLLSQARGRAVARRGAGAGRSRKDLQMNSNDTLARLAAVIDARRGGDPDKSYVARLFSKGSDAILKKVGEEATEVVMAAQGRRRDRRSSARWPTCGSIRCCCWRSST